MSDDKVNKWIASYVQVRDAKRALEEQQAVAVKGFADILDMLEGKLQEFFNTNGLENIKTEHGTAFTSKTYRASLADPSAFMDFVVDNQQFSLIDRKANTTAVRAFVEKNKTLPPGCNLSATTKINVRRPGLKEE